MWDSKSVFGDDDITHKVKRLPSHIQKHSLSPICVQISSTVITIKSEEHMPDRGIFSWQQPAKSIKYKIDQSNNDRWQQTYRGKVAWSVLGASKLQQ